MNDIALQDVFSCVNLKKLPFINMNDNVPHHSSFMMESCEMSQAITRTQAGPLAALPALFTPDARTAKRTLEFFTAQIRNPNTRRAYARAASRFSAWCAEHGLQDLQAVEPFHVAAYIETLQLQMTAPSVKLQLAALRVLFDWLVVSQIIPVNPASSVRGRKHSVKKGETPVLAVDEARTLIDAIDTSTITGLRDRALIGLMVYTFARVGVVIKMQVEDVDVQGQRTWIRLHEKGGKEHEMPCHHNLDDYLHAYLASAQLGAKAYLFCSATGRSATLSNRPMSQSDVWRMISRLASRPRLDTTPSGPPASPNTCAIAESWRLRSRWPTMKAPARRAFMTGETIRYRSMRCSGS